MVTQQGDTLWLALAQEGGVNLVPTEPRPVGLFELQLLKDGKAQPYTYQTDGFLLTLYLADGKESAAIAHDTALNALRIQTQNGVTLRLDGKMPSGVSSLNKPHWGGTEVNIGGGKYFFIAKSGTISFDDTWVVASFGSVTPILDVAPDASGAAELIAYELAPDTAPPEVTQSFTQAAAANRTDYEAFAGKLLRDSLSDELKYKIWLNSRKLPNGHYAIVGNRLQSSSTNAAEQAIASFAFKDGDSAIDVMTSLPQSSPPLLGAAALALYDIFALGDSFFDKTRELKGELENALKWWDDNRHYPGGYYYAYRHETGLPNPPGFKDNGFAPDPTLAKLIDAHKIILTAYKETWDKRGFSVFGTMSDENGNNVRVYNEAIQPVVEAYNALDLTQFAGSGLFADILKEVKIYVWDK
jgi:hypothetical protein